MRPPAAARSIQPAKGRCGTAAEYYQPQTQPGPSATPIATGTSSRKSGQRRAGAAAEGLALPATGGAAAGLCSRWGEGRIMLRGDSPGIVPVSRAQCGVSKTRPVPSAVLSSFRPTENRAASQRKETTQLKTRGIKPTDTKN